MSESSTSRKCKTPRCKKPAEPNSEYCLACQQRTAHDRKHKGAIAASLGALVLAIGGAIFKIVSGGKGAQKG